MATTIQALVCVRCGGALPAVKLPAIVECPFCRAGLSLSNPESIAITRPPSGDTPNWHEMAKAFRRVLKERMAAGDEPMAALRTASIEYNDRTSTTAHLILAIAKDFDREHGTGVATDAAALDRIAEKYLKALVELRSVNETTIDCPFLAATASGPKHLERRVTPAILQHMLAGIVEIVPT